MANYIEIAKKLGLTSDIFRKIHILGLKFGIQIIPNHYYSSVADIEVLRRTQRVWAKKSEMPGIESNLDEQAQNLKRICLPYKDEYIGNRNFLIATSEHFGPGFGPIEAQALHAVIRHYKPNRIIEVGSGVSTYCSLKAIETNGHGKITCIEPYPSDKLRMLPDINLIEQEVQQVPLETFAALDRGDLLFIDSSHTVKTGSDVNYIILEVLPRLKPGVIIHFHDIFFPYDYQIDILWSFFQWSETSLLRAFLINNPKAQIIFCLSQLHYDQKAILQDVFPEYNPMRLTEGLTKEHRSEWTQHFPSSIYIQTY
jgi:predicted O-methyltransferase YrrM